MHALCPLQCPDRSALSRAPRQLPHVARGGQHARISCAASPTTTTATQRASQRHDNFNRAAFKSSLQASHLQDCIQQAEALAGADASTEGRLRVYHALQGMHQQLFRQLLRAGDLPAIQCYLRLLPPKPRLFTSLLKECTVHSHRPALLAVLTARSAVGLAPDAFCFCALITLASRQRDLDGILNAFHAAVVEGCANTVLCNATMAGLVRCQAYRDADMVWVHMVDSNTQRDIYSYNAYLASRGAQHDAQGVMITLDTMLSSAGLANNNNDDDDDNSSVDAASPDAQSTWSTEGSTDGSHDGLQSTSYAVQPVESPMSDWNRTLAGAPPPDAYSFSVVFKIVASVPEEYPVSWLLSTYHAMSSVGLPPNTKVATTLITAALALPGAAEGVLALVPQWRGAGLCDDGLYAQLLLLCGRRGLADRLADVWVALLEDGIRVTPHVYSALFAACASAKVPLELQELVNEVFDHMQATMEARTGRWTGQHARSWVVACNALIHYHAKIKTASGARAVLAVMATHSLKPDTVTYNTLIAANAAVGDLTGAVDLFTEMKRKGLTASEPTYVCLMSACAQAGRRDVAESLLTLMQQAGMQPSVQAYTSLIHACVKEATPASVEAAFETYAAMQQAGVAPTAVTYSCLLQACGVVQDVERALALYQHACTAGVLPSDECLNMLIRVCIAGQRLEEALNLVKGLARTHGDMQQPMVNSLVRALAGPYPDRALRIVALMRNRRMEPTRGTYLALVTACATRGRASTGVQLYRQLRALGHEPSREAGSALIVSLCEAGDMEAAEEVYADMRACAEAGDPGPKQLPKRSRRPSREAVATLADASARRGALSRAKEHFVTLCRDGDDARRGPLTISHRNMWEALIEAACRKKDIKFALDVFDTWKAAVAAQAAAPSLSAGDAPPRHPKLSNATLAFLESCCRQHTQHEWRVYDVCAVMRRLTELKHEEALARPAKESHHVSIFNDDFEDPL